MSKLNNKLFDIASQAVNANKEKRDARGGISKAFDVVVNKSYTTEDKKTAAAALRE